MTASSTRTWADPKASFVDVIQNFDNAYDYLGNDGPIFYFRTDLKAPMHRVVSIDLKDIAAGVKEIIPQDKRDNLTHVSLLGNQFIASYLKDAQTAVKVFKLDGSFLRNVELPGVGTASGFGGQRKETETFYSFSSFATPPSTYRYDLATGTSELLRRSNVKFDPAEYEVHQLFYSSKDGTRVPMFVSHKKGIKLDGSNPTLLYGYGGFNISLTPAFSISKLQWMEMGGIYAQASIRGGGEYGKDWHQAAVKLNRPKAYEDFIAGAEFLIEKKYTSTPKLAIQGGSNGGLLGRQRVRRSGPIHLLCCVFAGRRRHGHAAFPQVHGRPLLGRRLRQFRRRRAVQGLVFVLAVPQPEARREVSGHAGDDGRHRRSRGAVAQLQVHRGAAARSGGPGPGAGPHRDARRPWCGPADIEDHRGSRRPVGVSRQEPRHEMSRSLARRASEGRFAGTSRTFERVTSPRSASSLTRRG